MKRDRLMTILATIMFATAVLEGISGKFIYMLFMLVAGWVVILTRGTGKFNERSLYEKVAKAKDITIADVYDLIKDVDTQFGKPWLAEHTGYKGDSIIFGPGKFKDMVVISYDDKHKEFCIKHINKVGNIKRAESEEWRFEDFVDVSTLEVNPASFSDFAAGKVYIVVLLASLAELIERLAAGEEYSIPKSIAPYKLTYYNSQEGYFVDNDGKAYMTAAQRYDPFEAAILDLDGNKLLEIVPNDFDKKGKVIDSAGYRLMKGDELLAEVERLGEKKKDCFVFKTYAGEFKATNFKSVDRANIAYNYIITKDGEDVAIAGGNSQLKFENLGMSENNVILTFNEDYQDIYNVLWIFIMTLNRVYTEKKF